MVIKLILKTWGTSQIIPKGITHNAGSAVVVKARIIWLNIVQPDFVKLVVKGVMTPGKRLVRPSND